MRRNDRMTLAVIIVVLASVLAAVVVRYHQGRIPSAIMSIDLLAGIAVFFSIVVAYLAYVSGRTTQTLTLSEERRDDLIKTPRLAHIRMLIEHNDIELQTIVMILNISDRYEYDSDTLPRGCWALHEQFDQYLDYLEGVAILYSHGHMFRESAEGLFEYSLKRLRDVNTLDADTHAIKLSRVQECMEDIYQGKIPERIWGMWQEALRGKAEDRVRDPVTQECISPLANPVWYYVNSPGKEFKSIRSMWERLSRNACFRDKLADMIRTICAKLSWHGNP